MAYPAEYVDSDFSGDDSWNFDYIPSGEDTPSEEYYVWTRPNTEELVKQLQELIRDYPEGLPFRDFPDAFFKKHQCRLNPAEYGHETIEKLMMEFNDIIETIREGSRPGDWMLVDADTPDVKMEKIALKMKTNLEVIESVKTNITKIVSRFMDDDPEFQFGFPLDELQTVYQELYNCEVDYNALGYDSLASLCIDNDGEGFHVCLVGTRYIILPDLKPWDEPLDECPEPTPPQNNQVRPIFAKDVAGPDDTFLQMNHKLYIKPDEMMKIKITEFKDPVDFHFRLNVFDNIFNEFKEGLYTFYQKNAIYDMKEAYMAPGQLCVVAYSKPPRFKDTWERGQIIEVTDIALVIVLMVDYGTKITVPLNRVYFLHKQFLSFPIQAIPGMCAGLLPSTSGFDTMTLIKFDMCVKEPYLNAHAYNPDFAMPFFPLVIYSRLCNKSFNKSLIDCGHVEINPAVPYAALSSKSLEPEGKEDESSNATGGCSPDPQPSRSHSHESDDDYYNKTIDPQVWKEKFFPRFTVYTRNGVIDRNIVLLRDQQQWQPTMRFQPVIRPHRIDHDMFNYLLKSLIRAQANPTKNFGSNIEIGLPPRERYIKEDELWARLPSNGHGDKESPEDILAALQESLRIAVGGPKLSFQPLAPQRKETSTPKRKSVGKSQNKTLLPHFPFTFIEPPVGKNTSITVKTIEDTSNMNQDSEKEETKNMVKSEVKDEKVAENNQGASNIVEEEGTVEEAENNQGASNIVEEEGTVEEAQNNQGASNIVEEEGTVEEAENNQGASNIVDEKGTDEQAENESEQLLKGSNSSNMWEPFCESTYEEIDEFEAIRRTKKLAARKREYWLSKRGFARLVNQFMTMNPIIRDINLENSALARKIAESWAEYALLMNDGSPPDVRFFSPFAAAADVGFKNLPPKLRLLAEMVPTKIFEKYTRPSSSSSESSDESSVNRNPANAAYQFPVSGDNIPIGVDRTQKPGGKDGNADSSDDSENAQGMHGDSTKQADGKDENADGSDDNENAQEMPQDAGSNSQEFQSQTKVIPLVIQRVETERGTRYKVMIDNRTYHCSKEETRPLMDFPTRKTRKQLRNNGTVWIEWHNVDTRDEMVLEQFERAFAQYLHALQRLNEAKEEMARRLDI